MGKEKNRKPGQSVNKKQADPRSPAVRAGPSGYSTLGLWAILLLFVSLSTLYSLMVPLTQGEDELAHYRYLSFIAQTGRLPLNFEERRQAWYRADWPPLYHLLVGWTVSPLDTSRPALKDVGEAPHRRLVGEIFYPRLIIYTEDVRWPWQDGILAWHLGRFMSILFAAAALLVTYRSVLSLGQGVAADQPPGHPSRWSSPFPPLILAGLTTTLLALTPRFLFTSAMLGDDSLFVLLSAIFIALLLRIWRGDDRCRLYGLAGLVLGLSITTKYSTGLLPLVIVPLAWWRARQQDRPWPAWAGRVALSWAATGLGASWWFAWISYYFNTVATDGWAFGLLKPLLNTGPDVSMNRIFAFFSGGEFTGQARPDAIAAGTVWQWWVYLFQTFWGVPVLEHDPLFPWLYGLMLALVLAAGVGLWQLWRQARPDGRFMLALLSLIVALLLLFPILRFFLTRNILETGQGRHLLYPAAQAIPLLLVLGWLSLSQRLARPGRAIIYVSLVPLFLLGWSIFQYLYMARTYPAPLPVQTTTFEVKSIPQPVIPQPFAEGIVLLGYDFQPEPSQAVVNLTLFWQAQKRVDENYRVQVELIGEDGQAYLTWLSHPLAGRYPTRAWDAGDVIRDELALPLAALPAGTYELQLNMRGEAADTPVLTDPYWLVTIPLGQVQPIAQAAHLGDFAYRLWLDRNPARHRQTLALTWQGEPGDRPTWALLGPDGAPRLPLVRGYRTDLFMVGADWPSGAYRLQAQNLRSESLFSVANEARRFALPPLGPDYTPVEANFANQIKLLGYVLPSRRVEPGQGLPVTLYWQSLAPVLGEFVVFDVLLAEDQQAYGGYDRLPREYYSPILWAEGEVVEDGFAVPVRPEAPPGIYHLHLGLYSRASGQPVSLPLVIEGQLSDVTSVVIGPLKVGGPPAGVVRPDPAPQFPLGQSFAGQITLLGYDLATSASQLTLTLYWRAETTLSRDYTTFLHLRNQNNETVSQKDGPPAGGRYPTSLWETGEVIRDEISLPVEALPPGDYTPVIGLYDFVTNSRLATEGVAKNEIRLESVTLP
jgi:4-amino-4-deoxy-L-arabinose transferase-like glycosyltransferase